MRPGSQISSSQAVLLRMRLSVKHKFIKSAKVLRVLCSRLLLVVELGTWSPIVAKYQTPKRGSERAFRLRTRCSSLMFFVAGGAVALDGRISAGDMILQVNDISFDNFTNDQAVDVLRCVKICFLNLALSAYDQRCAGLPFLRSLLRSPSFLALPFVVSCSTCLDRSAETEVVTVQHQPCNLFRCQKCIQRMIDHKALVVVATNSLQVLSAENFY